MQRASFRSRPAPASRFHEGVRRPDLVLIQGGKAHSNEDEGAKLVGILIRIWFPWDFGSHEQEADTGVFPIVDDIVVDEDAIDRILADHPVQKQTVDEYYEGLTRQALDSRPKKPKREKKPRTVEGMKLPLRVHPRALGQFVRFFFNTVESTRAYINRKLVSRFGAEVLATMTYAEIIKKREVERKGLIMRLSTLIANNGKRSREECEWRIRVERQNHAPRVFYAEFDSKTGEILKFLLEKDRGRRKAFKTARKRCYRRNKL